MLEGPYRDHFLYYSLPFYWKQCIVCGIKLGILGSATCLPNNVYLLMDDLY